MYLYIRRRSNGDIKTKIMFKKMNDSTKWTELCIPDGCSVDCESPNTIFINGVSVDIDEDGNLIGNRKEIENKIVEAQQINVWVGKGIGSMRGGNVEFNF